MTDSGTRGITRAELAEALETLGIGYDFNAIRSIHIDTTQITVVRAVRGDSGAYLAPAGILATHTTTTPIVGP